MKTNEELMMEEINRLFGRDAWKPNYGGFSGKDIEKSFLAACEIKDREIKEHLESIAISFDWIASNSKGEVKEYDHWKKESREVID